MGEILKELSNEMPSVLWEEPLQKVKDFSSNG